MPFYHRLGKLPAKRHTTFFKPDQKSLYREELFSTLGFSGVHTNKYHIHMPTRVREVREIKVSEAEMWKDAPLLYYHFFTDKKQTSGDFISARQVFLRNSHCILSTAHPDKNPDMFYRNAFAHEYVFVHHGSGHLLSEYGKLNFEPGDQILVPRGTTYQMFFDSPGGNKLLICESDTAFDVPKHYRNEYGQMLEGAPFCERDIKLPEYFEPVDQQGEFKMILKAWHRSFEYILPHHPFDVVGWDGYNFPHALNIKDYCPIVGKIHLPPPVHLLYKTQHFVLCNFVPRPFDFHPDSIPAPYFHSNIDSDEILYYVDGDFMSRKGVVEGSITLHPGGLPHGPQPGRTEASIGKKETSEFAIMIDTFEPLLPTVNVRETIDPDYARSWLDENADGRYVGTTS